MITSKNKLEIFESFQIDRNLPKYTKGIDVDLIQSIPMSSVDGSFIILNNSATTSTIFGSAIVGNNVAGLQYNNVNPIEFKNKPSFWRNFFSSKKKNEEKRKTITILSFFTSLAQSLNDLKTLQDIAIHYEIAITNAAKAGQSALVDKLKLRLESAKCEAQLVTLNLNKFLIEDQVVDFYKKIKNDKNLKLTWIKHFVKPIPTKVLEIKENLDKQFIFDNYVILHYDPNNDATDLSTEEKEEVKKREKDPILFGVLKDSRRLYYVADWIDEYCDLTLDTVLETLGENVNHVNNDSVKTYIDIGERIDKRKVKESYSYTASTHFTKPEKYPNIDEILDDVKEKISKIKKKIIPRKKAKKKK